MKISSRVALASALAATITLILATTIAWFLESNSLTSSVDNSLTHAASTLPGEVDHVTGASYQLVFANGGVFFSNQAPVNALVKQVALGRPLRAFTTVKTSTATYRELAVYVPAGTEVQCSAGTCLLSQSAAEVFSSDVTAQAHELSVLALMLILLVLAGVVLAAALTLIFTPAALAPLERLTSEVSDITTDLDLARRATTVAPKEISQLASTFNRLLVSLQESQATQSQLVADAAHELRTPLTSLRTNTQMLVRPGRLTPDDLEAINIDVASQIDELSQLVTNLTELARGTTPDEHYAVTSLDEALTSAVSSLHSYAASKQVTIDVIASPSLVRVVPSRLDRALTNLLSNALKYTPAGGAVRVTTSSGHVLVEDSGPGIEKDDLPHIFERFYRSPSARSLPGSGLGLAIVAAVAKESGGTISATSSSALGGAAFTLQLPELPDHSSEALTTSNDE